MKIIVVGGTGFLGARTVEALRRFEQVQVEVASRRGPLKVDLDQPETFVALEGADVIVDLTDGTTSRPDALARFCLERGLTLLEATSDAETVKRLIDAHAKSKGPGRLVLGGGIFTGVSNLMARAVSDAVGPGASLRFAVASSPFSGAGKGTVALMVEGAARAPVRTVNGARQVAVLERGPQLDFSGTLRPTMRGSLAEAEMLPLSTGAKTVDTWFAPKPGALVMAFTLLPAWLLRARWFKAVLAAYFTVLRRFLLGAVPTSVQLVARAEVGAQRAEVQVSVRDGMDAGAWALAAMAEAVGRAVPGHGLSFIDDVVRLDHVLTRVEQVAGTVVFEVRRSGASAAQPEGGPKALMGEQGIQLLAPAAETTICVALTSVGSP